MGEKHYHIWRLSRTCTAWFFTQGWKIPDTTRATPANQFDLRYEAERLVAQREARPRDLSRYMIRTCDGPASCPMIQWSR